MVGTLVLPLPKCGVIRSTWCVLGLPSRHWGPWLSNSCNESSICCPKFRLRDQHICARRHRSSRLRACAASAVRCSPSPLLCPKEQRKHCWFSIPWILGYMQLFHSTFITNQNSVPCTTGPGTVALSSFCLFVMCDSSLRSGAFILLQLVQITEWASFINDSPTHSCWFFPFLSHLFWQILQFLCTLFLGSVCLQSKSGNKPK